MHCFEFWKYRSTVAHLASLLEGMFCFLCKSALTCNALECCVSKQNPSNRVKLKDPLTHFPLTYPFPNMPVDFNQGGRTCVPYSSLEQRITICGRWISTMSLSHPIHMHQTSAILEKEMPFANVTQSNHHLGIAEPGHYTGDELAHTQGLSSVGIQCVLQKERKLLPHLRHNFIWSSIHVVKIKEKHNKHHPTVYLAILMRKMWDELLEELLGGDSGVHQLAQGDVGLLPHTLSCVSQPDIYWLKSCLPHPFLSAFNIHHFHNTNPYFHLSTMLVRTVLR